MTLTSYGTFEDMPQQLQICVRIRSPDIQAEADQSAHAGGFIGTTGHRRVIATVATTAAATLTRIGTPAHAQTPSPTAAPSASADTSELTQLAEGYLQQRADLLTTARPAVKSARGQVQATRSMSAQVHNEFAALVEKGQRYQEADGGYTKAEVDVAVTDVTATGQSATLQLTEHTRPYLPFTPQEIEEGAPKYEELSLPHTVRFAQGPDGAWLLSSDEADAEGGPTATTQVADVAPLPDSSTDACVGYRCARARGRGIIGWRHIGFSGEIHGGSRQFTSLVVLGHGRPLRHRGRAERDR
ncbi:hypothetical protein [Streptomyces flaveolus]|uniref:hypothetical protein n=1 Tax=Streptomyces flaveolus TaxID=67297 RepID=UPI0036F98698